LWTKTEACRRAKRNGRWASNLRVFVFVVVVVRPMGEGSRQLALTHNRACLYPLYFSTFTFFVFLWCGLPYHTSPPHYNSIDGGDGGMVPYHTTTIAAPQCKTTKYTGKQG
jgi:hypothetical protein